MSTNETARAAAFASQADRSRELAAGYVGQMVELSRVVRDLRDGTVQAIGAMQLPHRWVGARLDLLVDGIWIAGPDLKGKDARGIDKIEILGRRFVVTYDDGETKDIGPADGDVIGPVLSVDARVAVFDGETGKLLKDGGKSLSDFATADQGAKADTALQDSTAFATAAQGVKADTAVQPADQTKAAIGLGAVDNTADADKPISAATQSALDMKAPLASPALTGTPTAPTAEAATNTVQIATTAFVQSAVAALIDGSPGALDTLNELAAAMGGDPDFAATVTNAIAGKLAKSGNLSDLTDAAAAFAAIKQAATSSATGVVELATEAEGLMGTDAARVPPVAVVKAMLDAASDAGRTWQVVTRTLGTSYQNVTGGTIIVSGVGGPGSTSRALGILVSPDNTTFHLVAAAAGTANGGLPAINAPVPHLSYYKFDNPPGLPGVSLPLDTAAEFR